MTWGWRRDIGGNRVKVTFDLDVVRDERGFRLATGEVKESRMGEPHLRELEPAGRLAAPS
jgi:hypothetical protein